MPQHKTIKHTRCAECNRKRGELIRFRKRWICQYCLNPDWKPGIHMAPLMSSSAGDLLQFGLFKYGETQIIYEQVRKHGVKSKFSRQFHFGKMPKDDQGQFVPTP